MAPPVPDEANVSTACRCGAAGKCKTDGLISGAPGGNRHGGDWKVPWKNEAVSGSESLAALLPAPPRGFTTLEMLTVGLRRPIASLIVLI